MSNADRTPAAATRRHWSDLTEDEQARIKRLLTPDPEDNLEDLLARLQRAQARLQRAQQILEGTNP